MEITLEKIELVKDRTAVSYKEARQALIDADGSVVDAIISIEEDIDRKNISNMDKKGNAIFDSIKAAIEKGNASKIQVKNQNGDMLLNVPVNAGIIGIGLSPVLALVSAVAAFGFKCTIEIVKVDGSIIDISNKANATVGKAVEVGTEVYDKVKSSEKLEKVVDATGDMIGKTADTVKKKIKRAEKFEFTDDLGVDFEEEEDTEE